MFGRKANQIKALKQEIEMKDRILADRVMVLAQRNEEVASLTPRAARVEELEQGLKFANQTNQSLSAERDQLVKRVVDLETQIDCAALES